MPLLRGITALASGPAEMPLAKTLMGLSKTIPDFFVLGALVNQSRVLQVRPAAIRNAGPLARIHLPPAPSRALSLAPTRVPVLRGGCAVQAAEYGDTPHADGLADASRLHV